MLDNTLKTRTIAVLISLCLFFVGCSQQAKIDRLINKLQKGDKSARVMAVEKLGKIGGTSAIEALINVGFKSYDKDIQMKAIEALVKMEVPAIGSLINALGAENKDIQQNAMTALVGIGAPAVKPLITTLKNRDMQKNPRLSTAVRVRAALVLWKINKYHGSFDPLVTALKDSNPDTRIEAIRALAEIGNPLATGPLIAAMKDNDYSVKYEAGETLDKIVNSRSTAPLIAGLKDGDSDVRFTIKALLEKIGTPAVDHLITALKDKNSYIRVGAASVLWSMKKDLRVVDT